MKKKTESPDVSVIVCSYNHAKWIESGAANNSYTVFVNLGKKIPKEAFDIDCVSTVSIIMPGTINDP